MRLFGFEVFRVVRRIEGDLLVLRLLRIRDLFILRSTFDPALLSETGGETLKSFGLLTSLWRWLRSTFQVLYVIELKREHAHRVVGLIGLYDLSIGNRAYLSAVLFDPMDRRQGLGREAVHLLLDFLEKAGILKQVCVEVLKSNLPSLVFFQEMGFKLQKIHSDCFWMAKDLPKEDSTSGPVSCVLNLIPPVEPQSSSRHGVVIAVS